MSAPTPARVLGLDIGGSGTRALLVAGDEVLAEHDVGSANVSSVGPDAAALALDTLASRVGAATVDTVCAGAAGADTPEGRARLAALLTARFPTAHVHVVHDSRLVLAAAGLRTGAVVVAGTGSTAWARGPTGLEARAGGWGYLLGDEGSGYGLTRAALRRVLADADDGRAPSPLADRLLAATGTTTPGQLLDHVYAHPARRYWAGLARHVLALAAANDPTAAALVEDAAAALADLATRVCGHAGLSGPVLLAGGLLVHHRLLAGRVTALLAAAGLGDVHVVRTAPAWGAVRLARDLAPARGVAPGAPRARREVTETW